jgi:serine/threonine protein kinase
MAPEIVSRETHSQPCDIWSLGIILYNLLSNSYPFSFHEIQFQIFDRDLDFPSENWQNISNEAKDLIKSMLNKESHKRITAKDALNH